MNDYKHYLKEFGDYGEVTEIKYPIIKAVGLPGAKIKEIVIFESGEIGQILDLSDDYVRILLFSSTSIKIGTKISRTDNQFKIPARMDYFGHILDPFCNSINSSLTQNKKQNYIPVDITPPNIDTRARISKPLTTGIALVDIALPLGLGQRQLILGDRKTGKSTFVLSIIKNQINNGAVAIYAAIGNKKSEIKSLEQFMNSSQKIKENMIIVASSAFESPGLIFLTPFTAMTIAEHLRDNGRNVILIMDDLLTHAKFYREFSLLAETFPGRDSYPGDIFHIHAKLLERAGNFRPIKNSSKDSEQDSVSITCLPIAETQDADLTSYIISNLMSITDGHLLFDGNIYAKGHRPAINTSISVTRVGKQTQNKLMQDINRELSSLFSVYERVENLSHFGTEVSSSVKNTLDLGEKIQFFLNQPDGIIFEKEIYLTVFCLVWLGIFNTESEIENARERLIIKMENKESRQFLTEITSATSLNDLLRNVGNKKDTILKMIV